MTSVLTRRMPRMHSAMRDLGAVLPSPSQPRRFTTLSARRILYQPNLIQHPRRTLVCPTAALFSKHSSLSHENHTSKTAAGATIASSASATSSDVDKQLLSADDDLMVGNEGLETIDPKDYPELYPEGLDAIDAEAQDSNNQSVLLSDKERSNDEMSWFVDASYPENAASTEESHGQDGGSGFVPLWQRNAERNLAADAHPTTAASEDHSAEGRLTVTGLVKLLETERAKNVHVIDMRDKCDWTNWMIICEGMSERHLGNLADHIYSSIKKHAPKSHPPVMEGRDTTDWIVIDADTVVLHFMTHEARKERDLEGLWASVTNPLKMKDAAEVTWDDIKGKMTKSWKEDRGRAKGQDGKRGRRGERDIPLSEVVRW